MVLWKERHLAYRLGFLSLLASVAVYVLGFSLPYWSLLRLQALGYSDQTIGLWQSCLQGSTACISNVHGNNPPWINAARVMATLALALFAVVVVSGCYRNLTTLGQLKEHTSGRQVECIAIIATSIGFVSCIIYAAEFQRVYVWQFPVGQLYWGFGLVCLGLGFSAFSASLMFAFNRDQHLRTRRAGGRRGLDTRPASGPHPTEHGQECVHIPYFGPVSDSQMARGAVPLQPPSYEAVTREGQAPAYRAASGMSHTNGRGGGDEGYPAPPADLREAPPLYEDVAKDLSSLPPEVIAHLELAHKDEDQQGAASRPALQGAPPRQ